MRKLIASLFVASLFMGGQAFAVSEAKNPCPVGEVLRRIGSVQAAGDAVLAAQGQDVRMVIITVTGTASNATLYDGTTLATDAVDANVAFEPAAAADTTVVYDFTNAPLYFKNGILFHRKDTNVKAVICYSCQPR